MADLQGNPHAAEALKQEVLLGDSLGEIGETDATIIAEAQLINARAILALAYEQRTANLIAVATHQDRLGKIGDTYWEPIADRLWIGESK